MGAGKEEIVTHELQIDDIRVIVDVEDVGEVVVVSIIVEQFSIRISAIERVRLWECGYFVEGRLSKRLRRQIEGIVEGDERFGN